MSRYVLGIAALTMGALFAAEDSKTPSPFEQGQPLKKENNQYPAAYNAPARTNVKDHWDWFVTASYLYWHVGQEGMDIATSAIIAGGAEDLPKNTQTFFQDFDYKSGFKVGLGINLPIDAWVLYAEYTRLHFSTSTSRNAPGTSVGVPIWASPWYIQGNPVTDQTIPSAHTSSRWRVELDFLDASLSRPFYVGRNLTINPTAGLRAAWIEQHLLVHARAFGLLGVTAPNPLRSHNHSIAWGIGPRATVEGKWLFCHGFRLQGDVGLSLLYMNFTDVKHREDAAALGDVFSTVNAHFDDYRCFRPMAEGGIGLGWSRYFYDQRYQIDFSATYDFNYLWSQNMMRKLIDTNLGIGASAGDLYMHGLTITGRFDF